MQDAFEQLAGSHESKATEVEILGRQIPVRAIADGVVWFDFEALCDGPRGAADYIEVARLFHTVLLSGVPQFTKKDNDRAARFIALVDELYDHSVNLLVTAVAAPTELYVEGRHEFAFQRTVSRLIEMQSRDYLHRRICPDRLPEVARRSSRSSLPWVWSEVKRAKGPMSAGDGPRQT